MEDTRMANSALEAGGTSRRSVGKGGEEPVSTGCRGLTTGVRQRGAEGGGGIQLHAAVDTIGTYRTPPRDLSGSGWTPP